MAQTAAGQKRVASFPVVRGKKTTTKWGVLMVQSDMGERLISPQFDDEKAARKWWEKNPAAGNPV